MKLVWYTFVFLISEWFALPFGLCASREGDFSLAEENGLSTTVSNTPNKNPDCESGRVCYSNYDCRGGFCFGLGVAKCNCLACINGTACYNDKACGGLVDACDQKAGKCNCEKAFKKQGYRTYGDAVKDLCSNRYCVPDTDSCYGLPCNVGSCLCTI